MELTAEQLEKRKRTRSAMIDGGVWGLTATVVFGMTSSHDYDPFLPYLLKCIGTGVVIGLGSGLLLRFLRRKFAS